MYTFHLIYNAQHDQADVCINITNNNLSCLCPFDININWTIDVMNSNETIVNGNRSNLSINIFANSIKRTFIHSCIFVMYFICLTDKQIKCTM